MGIKQAKKLGAEIVDDEVIGITYDGDYIVKTTKESFSAKAIILANGIKHTNSIAKNHQEENISYCAMCDGFLYKDKNVVVMRRWSICNQ